jgi:hypothetical protein
MSSYGLLADAVLLVHFGFVLFVVLGLIAVVVGGCRGRRWIRHGGFRLAHLGAIAVVVVQAWLGDICPLTRLEMWLRHRAGQAGYEGGFVQHWVGELLYYSAPPWVFVAAYTVFALLVLAAWWAYPPELPGRRRSSPPRDP